MLAPTVSVKQEPMSDRASSMLDEAADIGTMPLSDIAALRLYADRPTLDAISQVCPYDAKVDVAAALAAEIVPALPAPRLAAMLAAAVPHAHTCALRLANDLAGWAWTDERIGGCMVNFRRDRLVRRDGSPTPKVARRLVSPRFIRRYVKLSDSAARIRTANARLFAQIGMVSEGPSEADRYAFLEDCERAENLQRTVREAAWAKIMGAKTPTRLARRTASRSALAAESILGPADAAALRSGKPILIAADLFMLRITCHSVFHVGHGALKVEMLDKTTHAKLADLCTYQKDTPALDQAASLALELTAGADAELLANANVISTTEAGAGHPALTGLAVSRLALRQQQRRVIVDWRHEHTTMLDERELFDAYWRDHGDAWIEATAVFALGSQRWRKLARLFGGGRLLHVS